MAGPEASEVTLFAEPGASWRPLLWGPAFGLAGYLLELVTPGPEHVVGWVVVGLVLLVVAAVWVYARRQFLAVRLTTSRLWHGKEELPVDRIAAVTDVGAPAGARVLGGGWSVPRKYDQVPIRLDDDSVVLAWARDGTSLASALRRLVEAPDAGAADAGA